LVQGERRRGGRTGGRRCGGSRGGHRNGRRRRRGGCRRRRSAARWGRGLSPGEPLLSGPGGGTPTPTSSSASSWQEEGGALGGHVFRLRPVGAEARRKADRR